MGSHDGIKPEHKQFTAMLRMETDEGIAGAVQIESSARYARSVMDLTERRLKSLIGENPLTTERLWHLIWEIDRVEEMHMTHLGLVDQLAWDIKSKKAGHADLADAGRQQTRRSRLRLHGDLGHDGRVRALHQAVHGRRASRRSSCTPGATPRRTRSSRATCANGPGRTPT